jgi:diguanylate cyclase (GGDEF)-like protein
MKYRDWFPWLAISMVVLLGVAAAVFSRGVDVSNETLEQVMRYDVAWSGNQGRTEAAELERRIVQLALSTDESSLEAALVSYQILLSRIGTWRVGDFGSFLDRHPAMSARFDTLVSEAESLGAVLQNLADDGAIANAIAQAGAVRRTVDRIGMGAYTLSVSEMARLRDELHNKQTAQKVLIVLLFLVGFILFFLTAWQNSSLARANDAIAESARQLAEGEKQLAGVLASTTDFVLVLDSTWRITFANKNAAGMFFSGADYLGISIWEHYPDLVGSELYENYHAAMERQVPVEFETYLAHWDAWFEVHACPAPDRLTIFFRNVTDRRRMNDELVHLTRHDPLTNLANRTLFAERLASGLETGRRQSGLTLVLIDLDDFKSVNDSRGHLAGDRLLQQFAGRLAGLVREGDTVARLGGDEFAIIQPGPVDPEEGARIARRISEALLTPFDIEGSMVTLGTSIGIAIGPKHGTRSDELIRNADLALYRAKETKGTSLNYCIFEPGMEDNLKTRQGCRLVLQQGHVDPLEPAMGGDLGSAQPDLAAADEMGLYNARITMALNHMSQGLCMFDADKKLIVCNQQYAEMYGIAPEDLRPGTPFLKILQNRLDNGKFKIGDPQDYLRERIAAVEERKASVKVHHLTDGRSIAISHCPLKDGGWVATHEDITNIRRIEAKVSHMAHHDALTGLPNRILFREELERALARIRPGEHMSVLCLDLDQFKAVNDTLGHPIGDALLRKVAERLRKVTRGCDMIARLGGDEFAILQGGMKACDKAKTLAQRIIKSLSQPYEIDGHQVVIGTSVGIAVAPTDSGEADQLLKLADMALSGCKLEGRGVYCFFEMGMDARIQARRALELDLRRALAGNELVVHYQPLVNIQANRVTGFEALLRWNHAERGNVAPCDFIPLAEEVGLIGQIGAWVLKEACAEAAKWPTDVRLAVNLSPAQFKGRELVADVAAALENSGLPADRLELEITETVMLQDTEATIATLHSLRDLGVHISLDDFGTGCSSLSFLRRFPFDKLKIDQTFIEDMQDRGESLAIVRAVIELGSSLGMSTTAEGVETMEQLGRLRAEGCVEVQGYFFSPARPAGEITGLLASVPVKSRNAALDAKLERSGRLYEITHVKLVPALSGSASSAKMRA